MLQKSASLRLPQRFDSFHAFDAASDVKPSNPRQRRNSLHGTTTSTTATPTRSSSASLTNHTSISKARRASIAGGEGSAYRSYSDDGYSCIKHYRSSDQDCSIPERSTHTAPACNLQSNAAVTRPPAWWQRNILEIQWVRPWIIFPIVREGLRQVGHLPVESHPEVTWERNFKGDFHAQMLIW